MWAAAYGKADLEADVAATPNHLFRLGSVSKVLTSTAAARLVSRGLLDLDAPIAHWLPDLPGPHRATTTRQLLTHRGGIRHYLPRDMDPSSPGGSIFSRSYRTNEEILALFIDDALIAPPGTRTSYTSFGYTLASLVMEAAAGVDFRQLIKTEIGQWFGLPSLVEDDPLVVTPLRVRGYVGVGELQFMPAPLAELLTPRMTGGWVNAPWSNPAYSWAGAGFLMTAADTARFGAGLLDAPAAKIDAEERALLFTPLIEAGDHAPALGLGWRIDADASGRRRWHHAGATPGGRAGLVVYPDLGLSIAIAANVMTMPMDVLRPCADLADLFG